MDVNHSSVLSLVKTSCLVWVLRLAIDGWSYNNGTQTVTIHNNLNVLGEFSVGAGDSITLGGDLYVEGNIFATQDITRNFPFI